MRPAFAITLFLAGTALMMQFYEQELFLLGLMSAAVFVCLAIDRWKNTKMFLIAMVVGGACENIAVMLGAWGYTNAGFLFAPLWLPVGWGMSVVLLEEAFSQDAHAPKFSKRALAMAFGGTFITATAFPLEVGVLLGFAFVTLLLFAVKYYDFSELRMAVFAAIFGTAMETACIMAGNWHYTAAMFGTPLWLPLCWFNAFLIMRRIAR